MSITIELSRDGFSALYGVLLELTFQARGEVSPLTTASEFQTRTGVDLAQAEVLFSHVKSLRAGLGRDEVR